MESERILTAYFAKGTPSLRDEVFGIWLMYHDQAQKGKKEDYGVDRAVEEATAAKLKALSENRSNSEAKKLYYEVIRRKRPDVTIRRGYGITFATWIRGAGEVFGDEHLHCECC